MVGLVVIKYHLPSSFATLPCSSPSGIAHGSSKWDYSTEIAEVRDSPAEVGMITARTNGNESESQTSDAKVRSCIQFCEFFFLIIRVVSQEKGIYILSSR